MSLEHLDVVIVGAGISGVGAAYHLQERCPGKTYAILEARDRLGGTWDLFRYPGIRSDSDMHTLGYRFRPWTEAKSIADGSSVLGYVRQTARDHGIEEKIRFQRRVVRAAWSTAESRWTLEVECSDSGETERLSCGFLMVCSGYYSYDQGYVPDFEGVERFHGQIVHPQHWGEDVEYADKEVVVIGSGATAVTLVPALAKRAAGVTMLQRSPTYVVSLPAEDPIAAALRRRLPDRARLPNRALEERLAADAQLSAEQKTPALDEGIDSPGPRASTAAKAMTSTPISSLAMTLGISAFASCQTAICSRRSQAGEPQSSPIRSTPSPRRGSGSPPAPS